jgi:uncharacterized glyoxalase superfamily protein PhnB
MSEQTEKRSTVICGMRYRNAPAAIEWLCNVLGFARHAVYPGPDGTIAHAELTLGGGMIMLGSIPQDEFGQYMKQPDEIGGAETRSLSLIVADADVIYQRAKAAGAEMVVDIRDPSYGGREFTCRDPEGRTWSVCTYDPWKAK